MIQNAHDAVQHSDSVNYDAHSSDFNSVGMHGLPNAGSLTKFSFCCAPGEYSIHAIDTANDGWWGGAHYSVLIDGATVVHEEMNRTSSSRQTSSFEVALPPSSARTNFSSNKALQGGGGAIFWDNAPPKNVEFYRGIVAESNSALYGGFVATPARNLTATRHSYVAYSGRSMSTDPIIVELKDE